MKIMVIQVPYDCGYKERRQGLGPGHFIDNNLVGLLEADGHQVRTTRIEAESEARKIIAEAQEKGVKDTKSLIEKARIDAENEKSREMEKITQTGSSIWDEKKSQVNEIIHILFQKIL